MDIIRVFFSTIRAAFFLFSNKGRETLLPRPCDLSALLYNGRQTRESCAQFHVYSKLWELNKFTSTRKRFIDLKLAEGSAFFNEDNIKIIRDTFEEEFRKKKKKKTK